MSREMGELLGPGNLKQSLCGSKRLNVFRSKESEVKGKLLSAVGLEEFHNS